MTSDKEPTPALQRLTAEDYQARVICGWTVYVQRSLLGSPRLRTAAGQIEADLEAVSRWLPEPAVANLRKVSIWISANSEAGAAYHPSREWLTTHQRVPEMARSIEIQNLDHFLDWRDTQPAMMLHELAHAWHHRKFDFDHPAIQAAFRRAVESAKYEKVRHRDGRFLRHYALSNPKEYFAELTEAYFARNDFFPFVRAELLQFDPAGFQMVEEVWGVGRASAKQSPRADPTTEPPTPSANPPR